MILKLWQAFQREVLCAKRTHWQTLYLLVSLGEVLYEATLTLRFTGEAGSLAEMPSRQK